MEIDKEKIQKIIDRLSQPQDDMQMVITELKELINEKWEPFLPNYGVEYWYINGTGEIDCYSDGYLSPLNYGGAFRTKELAETARDMNKRNQLILHAKYEMGYGDGDWEICFDSTVEEWTIEGGTEIKFMPELTFETLEQAETVLKMVGLNG